MPKFLDRKDAKSAEGVSVDAQAVSVQDDLENTGKTFWQRLFPACASGVGLFSDDINNVIGSVSTILARLYGTEYTASNAQKNVSAIAFAGAIFGMLVFGYLSDHWSRRNSLLLSTVILFVFAALSAGAYGGGTTKGMFNALIAYRFLVGIGIGGEYPAGSVGCAEASGELKSGTRNRWFILFTNVAIDFGFVIGAFVPYILVVACTERHLRAAWRISLGLGCVCPLAMIFFRWKLKEPEAVRRERIKRGVSVPYGLVFRFYGFRLFMVSLIWFIYDSTYSFGIYSSTILANIPGSSSSLAHSFGWNTVINLFYLPGALFGSFYSDWVGPRYALASGVFVQAIVGFAMAGAYPYLAQASRVAGFAVMYGVFLSLGEVGSGDNLGLLASKTCATAVRGQYYGIAAAVGKVGALVGVYVFPYIEKAGGSVTANAQIPFYVSSSLCVLSAALALFGLPNVTQQSVTLEDARFRVYLSRQGWDISQLGMDSGETLVPDVEKREGTTGEKEY